MAPPAVVLQMAALLRIRNYLVLGGLRPPPPVLLFTSGFMQLTMSLALALFLVEVRGSAMPVVLAALSFVAAADIMFMLFCSSSGQCENVNASGVMATTMYRSLTVLVSYIAMVFSMYLYISHNGEKLALGIMLAVMAVASIFINNAQRGLAYRARSNSGFAKAQLELQANN